MEWSAVKRHGEKARVSGPFFMGQESAPGWLIDGRGQADMRGLGTA